MRITVKEASQLMGAPEQAVRMMIALNKIPGCCTYGKGSKLTYYISKEAILNFMKGGYIK